jgi:hypothetical protein
MFMALEHAQLRAAGRAEWRSCNAYTDSATGRGPFLRGQKCGPSPAADVAHKESLSFLAAPSLIFGIRKHRSTHGPNSRH